MTLSCSAAAAVPPVPAFKHVIVVVFENKEYERVLGSGAAPTFDLYARRYVSLPKYYAITHPSLPNYLGLVSGSTHGVKTNCTTCSVTGPSLMDNLEASGRTWKAYAEGLPRAGWLGGRSGGYTRTHNPFPYFRAIANDPTRRARIVPYSRLRLDLRRQRLPDFAFVIPDICHDMHNCSVTAGDRWLRIFASPLLKLPSTVLFVLFDEGNSNDHFGGRIAALVLGAAVAPGSTFAADTGHYGVLRTIEEAWGLPLLKHSAEVVPLTGIWR
jgi:acid phosphatase